MDGTGVRVEVAGREVGGVEEEVGVDGGDGEDGLVAELLVLEAVVIVTDVLETGIEVDAMGCAEGGVADDDLGDEGSGVVGRSRSEGEQGGTGGGGDVVVVDGAVEVAAVVVGEADLLLVEKFLELVDGGSPGNFANPVGEDGVVVGGGCRGIQKLAVVSAAGVKEGEEGD